MAKFIVGKRIAAIEWFHVEAETKEEALDAWTRGGVGVEFRGQGDAEEFLDDMIVQEWGDKSEPSVLPPLYASAPRLAEQVRILREALADLCDSQLTSRDREDAITRGLAALEATKEGA